MQYRLERDIAVKDNVAEEDQWNITLAAAHDAIGGGRVLAIASTFISSLIWPVERRTDAARDIAR